MSKSVDLVQYSTRRVSVVKVRPFEYLDELKEFWKVLFV